MVFNIPFTQNVLQIPPDQSTFAGTGVGIYNKIVHEFLPYVLVYHSMFDRNLQTFNTVQAGNLTFIFYTLQKTNVALWLYLEMFALVAFIKLYTGKGFEFIKNMCVFIDYEKGIIKSTHEELLGEIKRNIQVNLKVNPDNFPELIDIYNSCFSENILSYDIQDGNFKWRS